MARRSVLKVSISAIELDGHPVFVEDLIGNALAAAARAGHQQRPLRQVGKPNGRRIGVRRHIEQFLQHERFDRQAAFVLGR